MSTAFSKDITCIVCPVGCKITIQKDEDGEYLVTGNTCKRGRDYAIEEMTHPMRMLTSTVKIDHPVHRRLPVHSSAAVPKEKLFDVIRELDKVEVKSPVKTGQVVLQNVLGLGVDICASRDC